MKKLRQRLVQVHAFWNRATPCVSSSFLCQYTHFLSDKGLGEHFIAILGAYGPTRILFTSPIFFEHTD